MDLQQNLPLIIIAVIVLALVAFLLLRPRQRVQLSDKTPLRRTVFRRGCRQRRTASPMPMLGAPSRSYCAVNSRKSYSSV